MESNCFVSKNNGFSLIEVLVAIAVFSIGILAVAAMQVSAIKTNASAGNATRAIEIASDQIEQLLMTDYTGSDLLESGNPHTKGPIDGFTITWNIDEDVDVDGDGVDDAKRIDLKVSWHGRNVSLTCIRSQDD